MNGEEYIFVSAVEWVRGSVPAFCTGSCVAVVGTGTLCYLISYLASDAS
jgi:hypothetical protein